MNLKLEFIATLSTPNKFSFAVCLERFYKFYEKVSLTVTFLKQISNTF